MDKSKNNIANQFGAEIRKLRESAGLLQRVVASILQIDSPMLSKIEKGERRAKKDQVLALAIIFKTDPDALYTLWLADQLLEVVEGESLGLRALQLAEEEVGYNLKRSKSNL